MLNNVWFQVNDFCKEDASINTLIDKLRNSTCYRESHRLLRTTLPLHTSLSSNTIVSSLAAGRPIYCDRTYFYTYPMQAPSAQFPPHGQCQQEFWFSCFIRWALGTWPVKWHVKHWSISWLRWYIMDWSAPSGAPFFPFFAFFESCILMPLCTSTAKKNITHTNLNSPKVFPMRFEGMLNLNHTIEYPHFYILLEIEGGIKCHLNWGETPQLRCMVE